MYFAPHNSTFALCDSMPLAACLFARAYRCSRFRGEAAFGKDTLLKQTFYGFRVHLRVCWPGVITRFSIASANVHELAVVPELVESSSGIIIGDRNYHSPKTEEELRRMGIELLAPHSSKKRFEPSALPHRHRLLSTHGAVLHKEGVGQRPLASGESTALEGVEPYRRFLAQPSAG